MADLVIARNPDADSSLPYLLWLPVGDGLVFRTSDTWPRTKALYCHPVEPDQWPSAAEVQIVERIGLRSCARRGAAIDVIVDRARESRSQIVYTRARGRSMVFWQSARTRKQARPQVRTPTARAGGLADLQIVVDSHERYAYRFGTQQVSLVTRALPVGDYGLVHDGGLIASVERKSLDDLVSSLTSGTLRYAVADLAALPRAAVVVEDRYSRLFSLEHVRPATVLDGLAELQVRWPEVPLLFAETRPLAEEWTYRFLAAAHAWALDEEVVGRRIAGARSQATSDQGVEPSTAEVRAWARAQGRPVSDRGRLRPEIWAAFRQARAARDADADVDPSSEGAGWG